MSSSSVNRRYSLIRLTGEGGHWIDDNAPEGWDDIGMDLTLLRLHLLFLLQLCR